MGRRITRDTVSFTLRIPEATRDAVEEAAQDNLDSMNAWILAAIHTRLRKWESPITREPTVERVAKGKWDGWVCTHGSHGGSMPAGDCPHREKEIHQRTMMHEGRGIYDGFRD